VDGQVLEILDKINFKVKSAEILGLIGASGSGKSMTAKSIMRLHQSLAIAGESGSIALTTTDGPQELLEEGGHKVAASEIGFVFQQSEQVLNPIQKIGKQLLEKRKIMPSGSTADMGMELLDLLEEVELHPAQRFFDAYPHQLSGGQIQRVLIALALINRPKLIIADEPLSALDTVTAGGILQLLQKIKTRYHTALIIISHDLQVVRELCDNLVFLDQGRVIEQGSTVEIFSQPKTPLVQQYVANQSMVHVESRTNKRTEPLFEIRGLAKQFQSDNIIAKNLDEQMVHVFRDYNMSIYKGEIVGLQGKSGSGKSTLGRILLRLETVDSGTILFRDQDIFGFDKKAMKNFRQQCQIIFQDPYSSMSPHRTLLEHFNDAASVLAQKTDLDEVQRYLTYVNLDRSLRSRLPHQLSGGQRQRAMIARALYMQVEFLVCDEILSSLDTLIAQDILGLIRKIVAERDLTVLFISHDQYILEQLCDRIISLN